MSTILLIAYVALGYWAANQTIYANKVMIGSWGGDCWAKTYGWFSPGVDFNSNCRH